MSRIVEEIIQEEQEEARAEVRRKMALCLLEDGTLPLTKIADIVELPLEELEELRKTVGKKAD